MWRRKQTCALHHVCRSAIEAIECREEREKNESRGLRRGAAVKGGQALSHR